MENLTQWSGAGHDNQVRVVIADDSALIRQRLDALLTPHTHIEIVGLAEDAPAATEHIRRLLPHAIVLDWHMPGGGGLQVLKDIQGEPRKPLVIVLTNYADEPYRARAMAAGADYFLDKSSEFSQVGELIAGLMYQPDHVGA
ncbi:MAG: response regulator transcription factor [Abitibacteriaceae bacterium]|nr:response regulator transcription factor [Abditibacteriaceae bacterium]